MRCWRCPQGTLALLGVRGSVLWYMSPSGGSLLLRCPAILKSVTFQYPDGPITHFRNEPESTYRHAFPPHVWRPS